MIREDANGRAGSRLGKTGSILRSPNLGITRASVTSRAFIGRTLRMQSPVASWGQEEEGRDIRVGSVT